MKSSGTFVRILMLITSLFALDRTSVLASSSSTTTEPHLGKNAQPSLSAIIKISGTTTAGVVGTEPFSPSAHDGIVRSQTNPKAGSYKVANLDRDASVIFHFQDPAVVSAVSIASSFAVSKRVHIDLLVGDEWVRVHDSLNLTFAVGVPVLVVIDQPKAASAVRLTSLDRHLFVDEFTAYSATK